MISLLSMQRIRKAKKSLFQKQEFHTKKRLINPHTTIGCRNLVRGKSPKKFLKLISITNNKS